MREALGAVQLQTRRKMAEIRQTLVPGVQDRLTPLELQRQVRHALVQAMPERQSQLKAKIALAVNDLRQLDAMLSTHLDAVRIELQRMNRHRNAATAYRRPGDERPRRMRQYR
ncbi:MAG: hypothetical protein JO255_03145, partial [Alphaproteobacteria bacterium]|nr:hypothetical protein [Alphaproteobacteria bacterium]